MFILINAFLLGTASGLRAIMGLAVVSWAARLGYVHLEHTWLAFLGFAFTPYILSLLAIGDPWPVHASQPGPAENAPLLPCVMSLNAAAALAA